MIRRLAYALVLIGWVWIFALVWAGPAEYQFDFKTYYCAAGVYDLAQNPYEVANLREFGGNSHLLGFYYPLSALHLMRPFGHLDYESAHRAWVVLKALALAGLLLVWKRWFLPAVSWLVVLVVGLLGFQAATMWDVKAGNVTVFEQLCLWMGFACLTRSRPTAFVACVVLASIAKLLPAAFLLLLFLPALRSRANTLRALAGAVAVALAASVPFAANPEYLAGFLRGLTSQHPPLQFNPSILGVVDELARNPRTAFLATGWTKLVTIAGYYALLIAVSWRLLRRALGSASVPQAILVSAMLYALLAPRLIVYSYMIAIVPALALVIPRAGKTRIAEYAVLAAVCIGGLPILPTGVGKFVSDASPLLLLWGCWLALVVLERRGDLAGD